MKTASLSGSLREGVGKKDANHLRKENRVPGVLYGSGEQKHFSISELDISKLVINPDVFRIQFDLNGQTTDCIIQDVQFHPVTDRIVHVDLLQIIPGKSVRVELPLRTKGTAVGVISGGRLQMLFRRVPVRGLADDLPEEIVIDVTALEIGDNVRVRDISVPNCTVLLNDSTLLAAVKRTRAAMSAASEADEEDGGGDESPAEGGDAPADGGDQASE
ncbi:MAG: 50S ribosomal protein L25 [Bacteroidetes bacterium]|nr:50S ribosomal protein L25 [Bacteroidota bacterium]